MHRFLKAMAILCLIAPAAAENATAQDQTPPVPVEKAAFHWPVFRNDYVMVLRVHFLPGRGSNFHTHSLDQISVVIEGGGNTGEVYGQPAGEPKAKAKSKSADAEGPRRVSFGAYSKKAFSHRSTNTGQTPFLNIVVALTKPKADAFAPRTRDVAGYTQIFDNERARAWRLVLDPGQTSGEITQTAPGMRISLDRGEIAELISGQADRGLALNPGDFYWQDPGATRSIRNIGTSKVELVEFELK